MKLQGGAPELFFFRDDGITPNNVLPVLVYRAAFNSTIQELTEIMETCFSKNQWTNNWRDIVLSQDHYHSTTHEVLGISKGTVTLRLGGLHGRELQFFKGDVIVIPAGVAHCAVNKKTEYLVVGGYPFGLSWDMIYCEPGKYKNAAARILALDLPISDPLYGVTGYLSQFWNS